MKYLLIGGAGFIGINFAKRILENKDNVIIFDKFLRKGTKENVEWLLSKYPNVEVVEGDIRYDTELLLEKINDVEVVHHLAAQVAVTTSVANPREDFEHNALGTLNVCEAIRESKNKPILIYASTNKVYGEMSDVEIIQRGRRYEYKDLMNGISEDTNLDFYSPYGCSKGAGDQYVRDYSRIYGLKTIVFRQSCIYGKRQFGIEDQGWVAWFTIASVLGKQITIYGDGMQVRDVLHVNDLFDAWELALKHVSKSCGQIYNIGGGPGMTMSLLELLSYLEELLGEKIEIRYGNWRPGDQKIFVSSIRKVEKELGWTPKISIKQGIVELFSWVQQNKHIF